MISIKDLSKKFGSKQVLHNINLDLEPGKIYGIVGENGAGKTTLFRCIAGLEKYNGEIKSPFNPLKNHCGFLQTQPIFLSKITGWEYLKLLCLARNIKEENFEEQNIFDLPLNQYAETYSTGMKKKLALMGVLLQKNDIFILDEPFNGVDIHSNMLISAILKKLKTSNKIILLSSHIFATLNDNCDKIHLLKKGEIVQNVEQKDFAKLDNEMKKFANDNLIDRLKLD